LEAEPLPGRHQQGADHREAREHGAGHEVGREDRRVPKRTRSYFRYKNGLFLNESSKHFAASTTLLHNR
ncbi:MAG: hypothetical protein R6W69_09445, partial [Anaerolineales bacterium]